MNENGKAESARVEEERKSIGVEEERSGREGEEEDEIQCLSKAPLDTLNHAGPRFLTITSMIDLSMLNHKQLDRAGIPSITSVSNSTFVALFDSMASV